MIIHSSCLAVLIAFGQSAAAKETKKTVEEMIPLTMANIQGHKTLFEEGWFFVSSTEHSAEFAKREGWIAAGEEVARLRANISTNRAAFKSERESHAESAGTLRQGIRETGSHLSKSIHDQTSETVRSQWEATKDGFTQAWRGILQGRVSLRTRTEKDRVEFKSIASKSFSSMRGDFKTVDEVVASLTDIGTEKIENSWDDAFSIAKKDFQTEYERSGTETNAIMGLLHIFKGYGESIYHGLVQPTGKEVARGAKKGGALLTKAVAFPVASAFIVTGRTVQSLGLSMYYGSKIGYQVVAPTVEGGFLAAVSLASMASLPVTAVAGHGLGFFNQVAVSAVAPAVSTGADFVATGASTAKFAGLMTYDIATSSTKIIIKELRVGAVLGYNMLSALPTHIVMGAADSVILLAWDGPRLILAKVSGRITRGTEAFPVNALPVGAVIDLEKLREEKDVKVENLEVTQDELQKILEKAPDDFRK